MDTETKAKHWDIVYEMQSETSLPMFRRNLLPSSSGKKMHGYRQWKDGSGALSEPTGIRRTF
jgi:hypothetical protein